MLPLERAGPVRNPTFFIGCGRSGTTLLARLLHEHPDIAVYPYEANELWHPQTYPWATAAADDVPPIWADPRRHTEMSLARRSPADDRRLKATFRAYQLLTGGMCFVNKSVLITFMIDAVLRLFPDARFLHVVRDGRAVALSFARKDRKMIERDLAVYERRGYALPFEQLLDAFAIHWTEHVREVQRQRERLDLEGRILDLRYEGLCADPNSTLTSVARFLGVSPQPFVRRDYGSVTNRNAKFATDLPETTQARVQNLIASTLVEAGYRL